jgi:hypothetical protein
MKTQTEQAECLRCGNCCLDVGRTFWKCGLVDMTGHPWSNGLLQLAKNGDHEDGGLPCEMLLFSKGVAYCLIEVFFFREAKPTLCQYHNGDDRCRAKAGAERTMG